MAVGLVSRPRLGPPLPGVSASSGSISSCHPGAQAQHEVTTFSNNLPPLFADLSASNPTANPSFPRGSQCLLIQIPQERGSGGLVTEPVGHVPLGQVLHPTGA